MSFDALLVHTATIQRRDPGADRFNQPLKTWTTIATVRCRLTNPRGGVQMSQDDRGTVKADYTLFVPAGTVVGEECRIGEVRDATGALMAQNLIPLLHRPISTGNGRVHHIEIPCELFREKVAV